MLVGAIDVATDRIETPEEVAATIRTALRYVPAERLYPCTNCGMVPLARDVARGKLRALGGRAPRWSGPRLEAGAAQADGPGSARGDTAGRRPPRKTPLAPPSKYRWRSPGELCILRKVF